MISMVEVSDPKEAAAQQSKDLLERVTELETRLTRNDSHAYLPPAVDGVSSAGLSELWARADHVHKGVTYVLDTNGEQYTGAAAAEATDTRFPAINGAATITGLWTFDRDPLAPFAVTANSAYVPNLDADLLDGYHAIAFPRKAEDATIAGGWTFTPNQRFSAHVEIGSATEYISRGVGTILELHATTQIKSYIDAALVTRVVAGGLDVYGDCDVRDDADHYRIQSTSVLGRTNTGIATLPAGALFYGNRRAYFDVSAAEGTEYIYSATDGHLDLVADISVDINANLVVSAGHGITAPNYYVPDGGAFGIEGNELLQFAAAGSITVSGANLLLDSTNQIQFRDTDLSIYSSADGVLNIGADTTIAMAGAVTMDTSLTMTTTAPINFNDTAKHIGWDGTNIAYVTDSGSHAFAGAVTMDSTLGVTGLITSAGITLTSNLTMPEDGWIGIAGPLERFVFNGSAGTIEVRDAVLECYDALDMVGNPLINVSLLETAAIGPYIAGTAIEIEEDFEFQGTYSAYFMDSGKVVWGTGSDASMYYDGTDMNLVTSVVAASDFVVACGTDKTLELTETVWEDIQFTVSSGKVPSANFPSFDTFTTNTKEYNFAVDDFIYLDANELSHWWAEATTVKVHIHTTVETANSTGADRFAKFTVYFAYADTGDVWTETSVTAELTIPTGTAAMTLFLLEVDDVALAGKKVGTQAKVTAKRIAATGGTEKADGMFITQVGVHAEKDTMGSRQVLVK